MGIIIFLTAGEQAIWSTYPQDEPDSQAAQKPKPLRVLLVLVKPCGQVL